MRTRLLQLLTHWLSQLTGTSTHKPAPTKPSQAPTPPATKAALYGLQTDDLQTDDLQTEIRLARKFSLAEAIGREGGSFMKGESAIPRPLRAATELNRFIATHLREPTGALATTLYTWSSHDIRVSRQLDTPLVALAQIIESLLTEPTIFLEFARQVAIAHSRLTGDRPYFQQPGQLAPPDAEHTHQSITQALTALLNQLYAQLDEAS
ncbi:MAG: hypothetical protein WA783_14330 [Phormidesmis sp.]